MLVAPNEIHFGRQPGPEAGAAKILLAPVHKGRNDLRPLTLGNRPEGEVEIVPALLLEIDHGVGARGAERSKECERNRKDHIDDMEPPIVRQYRCENASAVFPDPVSYPATYALVQHGFDE